MTLLTYQIYLWSLQVQRCFNYVGKHLTLASSSLLYQDESNNVEKEEFMDDGIYFLYESRMWAKESVHGAAGLLLLKSRFYGSSLLALNWVWMARQGQLAAHG